MDYLQHGVAWSAVQRMIIDAPGVEDTDPKDKDAVIALTDDNADQILNMINRINRQ